jgi:hypothetical protein
LNQSLKFFRQVDRKVFSRNYCHPTQKTQTTEEANLKLPLVIFFFQDKREREREERERQRQREREREALECKTH